MGVDLGNLLEKRRIVLEELSGKIVAIDAHNTLYQFLSIIRQPDGTPLMDSSGNITSHLSGLIYRTSNLVEYGILPVFVFDGKPPELKSLTLEERARAREEAYQLWVEAKEIGAENAFKYAQASARVTKRIIEDAKELLSYMGIPWVQAPSEGEAQASYLVRKGDAFCAGSQDFDSLLFGAPLLVRNLAITGKRKLPRRNVYVDVKPEIFSLSKSLEKLQINREQLIDIAILIGTDFNPGIKGIGPKTALKLVKKHDSLLSILKELGEEIENYELIQDFFREPEVTSSYEIRRGEPQEERIISFLCDLHDFSTERVKKAVQKLLSSFNSARQATLDRFW